MSRLDRFWIPTTPALRLATLRVLVGTYGIVYLLARLTHLMSYALDDLHRFAPVGIVALAPAPTLPWLYRVLVVLLVPTSLAFLLGVRHRVLAPLHAALLLWVLSYSNSWGKILHTDNLFVLHVIALSLSPAADTLSFDARERPTPAHHPRYGWAPRLMVAIAGVAYLLAGIAKLRNNGLDFAMGETLRNFVAFDNARKIELGSIHSPLGALLVPYVGFFSLLAWGSLALELLAPLALHPRIGRAWAIAMWSFHVGVLLLMAIAFVYPLSFVAFAPLFEAERIWSWRPLRPLARRLGLGAQGATTTPARTAT